MKLMPGGGKQPGSFAGVKRVEFVSPRRTRALSVTGRKCWLNCAHCGGYYLKNMLSLEKALAQNHHPSSFLVSGGCNLQGKIPHLERKKELQILSAQGRLNIHSGLVTEEEARELGELAAVISFDFPASSRIISRVYGHGAAMEDYLRSYRYLKKYGRVIPHLCLGLAEGKIREEYQVLELLQQEGAEGICLLVFTPTPGTEYDRFSPPPLEDVGQFFQAAREYFPDMPLYLGCMRPGGSYRADLDRLALRGKIDKIVQPSPPARQLAKEMGLEISYSEECCCL